MTIQRLYELHWHCNYCSVNCYYTWTTLTQHPSHIVLPPVRQAEWRSRRRRAVVHPTHAGIQHSDWTVLLPQSHHCMAYLSPQTQPGSQPGTAVSATMSTQWCSPGSAPQISQAATQLHKWAPHFLKIKNKLCCSVKCSTKSFYFLHLLHAACWTVCVLRSTWAKFGAPAVNKQLITRNEESTVPLYMCICLCILCSTIIRKIYKVFTSQQRPGCHCF